MNFNKKRILLVVLICVISIISFICLNITKSFSVISGETRMSYVKEGENEFNLEYDAFLRNKPDFSSKVIRTISKGTHVQVLQELNKWVKITDGINEGWVVKQNVVTIEVENPVELPEEPPVEPENSMTNDVKNEVVDETTNVSNEVYNESNIDNSSISNAGKKGIINVDTAKVREKPDGKLVGLVDFNDKVEILAEEGDWYKVNVDEYKNCYIAKRLVTIK